MAKTLKNIFDPGVDQIAQTYTIESWHVSQSVDAWTGADAYDLKLSGSLVLSGSAYISGSPVSSGTGYSVLVINNTTGQVYTTGSYSSGGGGGTDTNIYNTDGALDNVRVVTLNDKDLTFDNAGGGNFIISSLPGDDKSSIVAYDDGTGVLSRMSTGSIPNLYTADGTLLANRTVTANGNDLTFQIADADYTIQSGGNFGGRVYLQDLRTATGSSIVLIDPGTGALSHLPTSSVSTGGGLPAGTSSMVQFNDDGAFGAVAEFTYYSSSQMLTIDKSSTATSTLPHLRLLGNSSTQGSLSGVIAASATSANPSPASIQFINAVAHGLGNYDTDLLLKTAYAGGGGTTVERTALAASASGDVYFGYDVFAPNLDNTSQSNVVGFNSSTGQLTYFATPSGGGLNLTRPGSPDQTINFDEINESDQETWDFATGGGAPSSTQFTTNNTSPASITQFNISETSGLSGDLSAKFATICSGGTLLIGDDNNPADTADYTIRQVIDQGSYYTIYVSNYSGGGLGTLVGSNAYRIGFDTDKQVVLDDQNYNRILIKNSTTSTKTVRFKANSAASAGDYYYVEITSNTGNADNMLLAYVFYTTGTTTTFTENNSAIYYNPNGTANTQLNINTAAQQAVIEFRVTPSGDLALLGGDKVIR